MTHLFSDYNPLFSIDIHARTARILVSLVIPGSIVFLSVIQLVGAGHTTQSYLFVVGYMICAVIQVCVRD